MSGKIVRGLAFRILLFLTLALLPIGLIAVFQTREIAQQGIDSAELSLLSVTEQASTAQRSILQEAFGAAQALGVMVRVMAEDTGRCSEMMEAYQLGSDAYSLVGFIDNRGIMACSSSQQIYNFVHDKGFQAALKDPVRQATGDGEKPLLPRPHVMVTEPVLNRGELLGFVTILIPHAAFVNTSDDKGRMRPLSTITFNAQGEVLTSGQTWEDAKGMLPSDGDLKAYVGNGRTVFRSKSAAGKDRVYSVLPLVPGTVHALSVWPSNTPVLQTDISTRLLGFMPVAMWLASLIVAFWALNHLAISHIRKLGRQMRRFARNRTLPLNTFGSDVPTEIVNMEEAFIGMADSILRDEAALEDSLREKNILLKEVHHRVKNNLQLISSIMNMQIRQSASAENKKVIQRLQDRILSLATVHKNLYQGNDLDKVNGGKMLREIVGQVLSFGLPAKSDIQIVQDYDDIQLHPDDAAPLTLLLSEAMTNAIKYVDAVEGQDRAIWVSLKYLDDEMAELCVSNTTGGSPAKEGTGLGSKLILAFTRQLNGQLHINEHGNIYELRIKFPVPQHAKAVYDY